MNRQSAEAAARPMFSRRRVVPSVCIVDAKQHVRAFLGTALEEFGFIVCECPKAEELAAVIDAKLPDLVLIALSAGETEITEIIKTLATKQFDGLVLIVGPQNSPMIASVRELAEGLGLAMLPTLATPFASDDLRNSVATFLPIETPSPAVDAAEAIRAGWLELWYQPKIHAHKLTLQGAEALIRMRHPHWGIVEPAYFIPDDGDPHFQALSEFVISQATADWRDFVAEYGHIDISFNLPFSFLQSTASVRYLYQQLPDHPAFDGFIIEVNGTDIIRDLSLARDIAKQGRYHKIAISIDDLGAEWSSLVGLQDFPFVEIKVDREFVSGCADDRLKKTMCRQIRELAETYGSRTVAEGVDTRDDFLAVRELGFDMLQGFLLGKPMRMREFARTMMRQSVKMPE
jgi:EAL domain-containing protein (putative c-di-GMP-specific phosphodiesterase class I)